MIIAVISDNNFDQKRLKYLFIQDIQLAPLFRHLCITMTYFDFFQDIEIFQGLSEGRVLPFSISQADHNGLLIELD